MGNVTFLEVEQNSNEWHKIRDPLVTGSNADTLLTQGAKKAIAKNGVRIRQNYYMARGHRLEPLAIDVYERVYDTKVRRVGFVVNDKFENAGCSPDGIEGKILIEVKCFMEKNHRAITKISQIPFKIMAQLQFNMMIAELEKARLIMFNPDIEDNDLAFCVIEVLADKTIQSNLAKKLIESEAV